MVQKRHWSDIFFGKLISWLSVFFFTSVLLFAAVRMMPGDPVALRMKNPDPERIAEIRAELGLDRPVLFQYGAYVSDFFSGDWGASLVTGRDVVAEIAARLPATLELTLLALGMGVILGGGAGYLGHRWRDTLLGQLPKSLGAIGLTVPIFWLGLLLIVVGSLILGWFPSSGRFDYAYALESRTGFLLLDALIVFDFHAFLIALNHLVLPAFCLSLYPAAVVSGLLMVRLNEPRLNALVIALRAKGLGPFSIGLKHVLRLVSGPLVIAIGTQFGVLLGGAVLTETVFSWPGMGQYIVAGVLDREIYVIQFALLLIITLIFGVVSLTECFAVFLNPLLKKGGG